MPARNTSKNVLRNEPSVRLGLKTARKNLSFGWAKLLGYSLLTSLITAGLFPEVVSTFDAKAAVGAALAPPSWRHYLGTDDLGRDLLAMLIYGARGALIWVSISVSLTLAIGSIAGLVSGYFGGLIDAVLMRVAEFVGILPRLLVVLLFAVLFEPSLIIGAIVLGATGWSGLARIVRAETLNQKYREHVIAARALGGSDFHIMRTHIAISAVSPIVGVIGPICASAILVEASLGYLGLSDTDFISWGDLIRNGQSFYQEAWWLAFFPGITIVLVCLAIATVTEIERP